MHRLNILSYRIDLLNDCFWSGRSEQFKRSSCKERIITGGGFGLPSAVIRIFFVISSDRYMCSPEADAGTGILTGTLIQDITPSIKFNDCGVNPFVRFTVYRNIFIQTNTNI
jgi:hypothetical protein